MDGRTGPSRRGPVRFHVLLFDNDSLRFFQPPINKKEKRGQRQKKKCEAEHLRFIPPDRRNLLSRKERQRDSKSRSNKAAESRNNQCATTIAPASQIATESKLQQRRKHIQERRQLQNHRQRKHGLESFLHATRSIEIYDDQYKRDHRLHDQRRMRRPIFGVNSPEPRRHVRIKSG